MEMATSFMQSPTQVCTITLPEGVDPIVNEIFNSASRYDALNRLIVAAEPSADGTLSFDLSNTSTRFTLRGFDSRGNATLVIDPKKNTSLVQVDGAGRTILSVQHLRELGQGANGPLVGKTLLPDGGAAIVVSTAFDGNSRVSRLIDDRGAVTTYGYDTLDRQVTLVYNDGATLLSEYDLASDVTRFTDANGSVLESVFDPLGAKAQHGDYPGVRGGRYHGAEF